jgi:hypothetical protein
MRLKLYSATVRTFDNGNHFSADVGLKMASWVVTCPDCFHTFTHTAIEATLIEASFRDPFRILPRPQIQATEMRACPGCKKESVYARSQLFYRAT